MINEQTQVYEHLALDLIGLGVPVNHANAIVERYNKTLADVTSQAITQATAELRAENGRLRVRASITLHTDDSLMSENNRLQQEVAAQIEANNRLVDRIDKLTTEHDQAQAQVAALRFALAHSYPSIPVDLKMDNKFFCGEISHTLNLTQEIADAYTAKVRQEAREAAVRECISIAESMKQSNYAGEYLLYSDFFIPKLQALLPQAEKEGGV